MRDVAGVTLALLASALEGIETRRRAEARRGKASHEAGGRRGHQGRKERVGCSVMMTM